MAKKLLFSDEELERCRRAREAIDTRFKTLDELHRYMEGLEKRRLRGTEATSKKRRRQPRTPNPGKSLSPVRR